MARTTERTKDKLTRKKAEKLIAASTNVAFLSDERFSKHQNKHVVHKAKHKIERLQSGQS